MFKFFKRFVKQPPWFDFPADLTPKLITLVQNGISGQTLMKDIMSGLVVGVVALPLAIAFAIASGVSPEKGLITAIVAGFLISALGGSRVQIGGPTGAFIVIVYAIVQEHGVGGLTIATFMAGIIIILMGIARLGQFLKFIPYPLIVGFTSGIAVIIFTSQIIDFLGLAISSVPAGFIEKWQVMIPEYSHTNGWAIFIGLLTILITTQFHRITKRIPGSLVAIILTSALVLFFDLPVMTIETTFGEIPNMFSLPPFPDISFDLIKSLIQPAFAIALLGGIESLLSAVVADGMIGGRHRPNAELVAQGFANMASAVTGGIPATGAIARTITNIKNGGRTPVAGLVHALVLFVIMVFFAPYAKMIPMACLAGILMVVAYNMSEWRNFIALLKGKRGDVLVLWVTFSLTVLFDLIVAIEIGVALSAFILMERLSESIKVTSPLSLKDVEPDRTDQLFEQELSSIPDHVVLYEINGALFFGAAQKFQDEIIGIHQLPKVMILRMRNVAFIDATGIHRLKEIIRYFHGKKVAVVLSGVTPSLRHDLEKGDIASVLAPQWIQPTIQQAIETARHFLETIEINPYN